MGQTSKKTIEKYMTMVSTAGRVWTEGEIISFRSLLNSKLNDMPDVKAALVERFNKSLDVVPFQLEKAQQMKGLQWLIKTQINKKGELRSAKTTFIGEFELSVMRDFASFEFTGLRNLQNNIYSGYSAYVPVYRMNATDGRWFEYSTSPQGTCEVTDICNTPRVTRAKLKAV